MGPAMAEAGRRVAPVRVRRHTVKFIRNRCVGFLLYLGPYYVCMLLSEWGLASPQRCNRKIFFSRGEKPDNC